MIIHYLEGKISPEVWQDILLSHNYYYISLATCNNNIIHWHIYHICVYQQYYMYNIVFGYSTAIQHLFSLI